MRAWTLGELAAEFGGKVRGDPLRCISGLATLKSAGPDQLSFLANPLYRQALASTAAGAVLIREQDVGDFSGNCVMVSDPYAVYARLTHAFDATPAPAAGIHERACVHPDASVDPDASIGPCAVIEAGAVVGPGTVIEGNAYVGARTRIGSQCRIRASAVIHHDCLIGNRVTIHSGAVIGDDGFGFAPANGRWNKIAQIGRVILHDDVDIGANTTIDRGALDDTIIHRGVIIDNLVQIAHNVEIGEHSAIAGCTGISGSTKIGAWCTLAGGVGLVGHIEICDRVHVTGMTMITKSITRPGSYSSGTAFDETDQWKRMAVRLRRLDEMARRLRELEGLVQKLAARDSQEPR